MSQVLGICELGEADYGSTWLAMQHFTNIRDKNTKDKDKASFHVW